MDGLAKEVFNLIKGLTPEAANVVAGMIVNEGMHYDLGDLDISKAYMERQAGQIEQMKNQVIRSFVSKRMTGESVDSLVALSEAISKAERQFRESDVRRTGDGRFGNKPGKAFHHTKSGDRRTGVDTVNALTGNAQRAFSSKDGERYNRGTGDSEAFVPGVSRARRVGQAANFLNSSVGGYASAPVQVGLATAGVVGAHASQAQAAFGPAMDRARYRYQGTERKLDGDLKNAITADRKSFGVKNYAMGAVIGGRATQSNSGKPGRKVRETWQPSATVSYFQDHLPNQAMARLQQFAGHQPPSEGIIIAADGKVGAQMVGKGDDWYLPFNLNNLGELKGGSYIRTRTHGGLTTEDVYTGLMSGAKQMSVVSHNGVFTMQFDDTLRGSRRYSQTARDMTERYGQILDAVKKGQVKVARVDDIDEFKNEELNDEAQGDPVLYRQLRDMNEENPTPSRQLERQWADDFLADEAANYQTPTGAPMTYSSLINQRVVPRLARSMRVMETEDGSVENPFLSEEESLEQADARVNEDPAVAINVLNLGERYSSYRKGKMREYRDDLAPLQLDGQGYAYAAKALQEQFPYFIKAAQWRGSDSGPKRELLFRGERKGAKDAGYVKPRFNRSDQMQEGYFDTSITGYGKVGADRTRYQNHRIQRTVETGYRPGDTLGEGDRARPTSSAPAAPSGPAGEPGGNAPQAGGGGGPVAGQQSDATKARAANLALIKHLVNADKFTDKFDPKPVDLDEAALRRHPRDHRHPDGWMAADPEYKDFTQPLSHFEDMNDADLKNAADRMLKVNARDNVFDVPTDLRAGHASQGGPRHIGYVDLETLDPEGDEEFNFGSPEFGPGRSPGEYSTGYQSKLTKDFRESTNNKVVSSPSIEEDAAEYINELQIELDAAHNEEDDDAALEIGNHIRGALLARQLHRYWNQAPKSPKTGGGSFGLSNRSTIVGGGGSQGSTTPVSGSYASTGIMGSLRPFSLN